MVLRDTNGCFIDAQEIQFAKKTFDEKVKKRFLRPSVSTFDPAIIVVMKNGDRVLLVYETMTNMQSDWREILRLRS